MSIKPKFGPLSLLVTLSLILVSLFESGFKVTKLIPEPTIYHKPTSTISQSIVTRVIDGDTIELSTGEKVRYIGIDTPERNECFFKEAKAMNSRLVLDKQVRLVKDVSENDRYGRKLRYVYVDNIMINRYLVRQGYAYVATYPPDVQYVDEFIKAQQQARKEQKGFWVKGVCKN